MRKNGMSFTIPQTRKFLIKKITMFSPFIIDECIVLKLNQEEFEDTKGVIIIQKSKKNRQHNGQKIPKRQSESTHQRRTDNTMAKRRSTKEQTTIYKT